MHQVVHEYNQTLLKKVYLAYVQNDIKTAVHVEDLQINQQF